MKPTDLSKFELFEPIMDFQMGSKSIDLHNDYYCNEIKESLEKKNITVYFASVSSTETIAIEFGEAQIATAKFSLTDKTKFSTLTNFYRGKFISPSNTLNESNENKQNYFYLDFFEGQHIEILAKQVIPFYA